MEKCRHELELQMKREGERAVMELGIHGLHPDLIKLIGRTEVPHQLWPERPDLQHGGGMGGGLLASEMEWNVTMVRRAGLLHDIGKALTTRSRAAMCRSVISAASTRKMPDHSCY